MLRVLCREDFSIQSAKMFAVDLKMAVEWLDAHFIYTKEQARILLIRSGLHVAMWFCSWFLLYSTTSAASSRSKCRGHAGYCQLRFCIPTM